MLTPEIKAFAESKIAKLEKFVGDDTTALTEVELSTTAGGQRTGDVYRAEINMQFTGGFARAEASRETLHAALDEAIEEIKRELRRTKSKRRDLMRRGAAQVKNFFRRFGAQ